MAYESDAQPIKMGYPMDFRLPERFGRRPEWCVPVVNRDLAVTLLQAFGDARPLSPAGVRRGRRRVNRPWKPAPAARPAGQAQHLSAGRALIRRPTGRLMGVFSGCLPLLSFAAALVAEVVSGWRCGAPPRGGWSCSRP